MTRKDKHEVTRVKKAATKLAKLSKPGTPAQEFYNAILDRLHFLSL
jgi:hypothetical protein